VSRQRFWRRRTSSVSTIAIKEKKNCEVTHEIFPGSVFPCKCNGGLLFWLFT
jgi:hypothetical protein